ncbi:MAG TPA: hypothetical protein VHN82_05725 [Methanoregula sp.]|nr:hypothetical protein [Methanoregula sp.]
MDPLPFLIVIASGIAIMCISVMLDNLWAQVLPLRFLYLAIRAPGVIVHECCHVLGCILTGATITKIVLLSREGGSVTYTRPKIPVLGDVIISSAPLFLIPLVLAGQTLLFAEYLGCVFPAFPSAIDSAGTLHALAVSVISIFDANLVSAFHPWFLLYLFLTTSLVLSMAPSLQDVRNAATGIVLIALAGIAVFLSGIPWAVSILRDVTNIAGMGFTLGLAFGLIALILSLPLFLWYLYLGRPQSR